MKEYKVYQLAHLRNPKKLVQEMGDTLHEIAQKGWDFVTTEGVGAYFF